jgi:hypothetical protein
LKLKKLNKYELDQVKYLKMNRQILFSIIFSIIFSILLFFVSENSYTQDQTDSTDTQNYAPSLSFSYLKNTDGIRILTCDIKAKKDKQFVPIENAEIQFYAGFESEVKLGTVKSNKKGRAIFEIKPDMALPLNDTGLVKFAVEYKGELNSESASEELTIKDISIDMKLEESDSVRTVYIKATKFAKNKEVVPLGDMEINVLVKRLYSDLVIGKAFLDPETGEGSVEFPIIPGDSVGDITIIARIDNSEEYGTVEKRAVAKWGTPVTYNYNRIGPALWSSHAPIWMTITLYIFLAGVWFHLILIFRRLYKVKKLGKQAKNESKIL